MINGIILDTARFMKNAKTLGKILMKSMKNYEIIIIAVGIFVGVRKWSILRRKGPDRQIFLLVLC